MTNNENDVDIRVAAQSIYDHIITMNVRSPQSPFDLTRSHSINLITEEFLGGYMQDGRMSVVRRFFCLFVTFDLVFIALLWLICIMITGDNIYNALKVQVVHYSVYTSLFDVVMAAICRFVVLILFYALLYINHWIIIALSTSGSCLFLISKVFLYDWVASSQPVFQVVLIVTSFVLAWGEAWFLDCRVIPQERHARRYFLAIAATQQPTDRSPLIAPFLSSEAPQQPTESVANFYSPYDSVHNSDDEDEEDEEYRKAGNECVRKAYELLESSDWKIEKVTKKGDTIQSTQRDKLGKIYRLTARIRYPAKSLLEELFYKIEDVPKWNPTLLESKIVRRIDTHTDITYQATIGGGGGLVKSRDFVNLRCWQVCRNGELLLDLNENEDDHDSNYMYNNDSCEGSVSSVCNDDDDDNDDDANISYRDNKKLINTENLVKKSTSEAKIKKDELNSSYSNISSSDAGTSLAFQTLSKSLGAKDFHNVNLYTEPPPLFNEYLDAKDHFDDTSEKLLATTAAASPVTATTTTVEKVVDKNLKVYVSAAVSVPYPSVPKTSKYTRGENLISCWAMREIEGKYDSCIFEWLLCLDLKGYIPKYVLDTAYTTLMQDYMTYLRKHCNELRQRRKRLREAKVPDRNRITS